MAREPAAPVLQPRPRRAAPAPARGPLRGLLELLAAGLCLWSAWYHTPPGALLRTLGARLLGVRSSARPLLAYYSAGVYAAGAAWTAGAAPPARALPPRALSPEEAQGWGAFATLVALGPAEQEPALRLAAREGLSAAALLDPRTGPVQLSALLARLAARLGSEDAAALALFCGEDAADYAARSAGGGAGLEELSRALPPRLCDRPWLAGEALALGTAAGLSWPVSEQARVTSLFGDRDHPLLGGTLPHRGVDLAVPEGTPVHAAGPARVRRASRDEVNGRMLVLDHAHGVSTLYLHNQELLVEAGLGVSRGERIARSGNSGRSTGPHLHYQLELGGVPVDPLRFRGRPAR